MNNYPRLPDSKGPKLLSTVVAIRHGARTPKERFSADSHWPFDGSPGQLTESGWQQSLLMGELLRSHYGPNFINPEVQSNPSLLKRTLRIKTTDANRCIETGKAILRGFLKNIKTTSEAYESTKGCTRNIYNSEWNPDSYTSVPMGHDGSNMSPGNIYRHPVDLSAPSTNLAEKQITNNSSESHLDSEQVYKPLSSSMASTSSSHSDNFNESNLAPSNYIDIIPYCNPVTPQSKAKASKVKQLKNHSMENSEEYKRISTEKAKLIHFVEGYTDWKTGAGLKLVKKFESASGSFQHHSAQFPEGMTDEILRDINKTSSVLKRLQYKDPKVGWLSGGAMLMDIIDSFNRVAHAHQSLTSCDTIEHIESSPKNDCLQSAPLIVYVTHQSSLLDLQAALGITHDNLYVPHFAGSIFAELLYIPPEFTISEKIISCGCQCFQGVLNLKTSDNSSFSPQGVQGYYPKNFVVTSKDALEKDSPVSGAIAAPHMNNSIEFHNPPIKKANKSTDAMSSRSKTESLDLSSEWSSNESCDGSISMIFSNSPSSIDVTNHPDTSSSISNLSQTYGKEVNTPEKKSSDSLIKNRNDIHFQRHLENHFQDHNSNYYIRWTVNGYEPLRIPLNFTNPNQNKTRETHSNNLFDSVSQSTHHPVIETDADINSLHHLNHSPLHSHNNLTKPQIINLTTHERHIHLMMKEFGSPLS